MKAASISVIGVTGARGNTLADWIAMDLLDVDLNLLLTFYAIHRHHGLSTAAAELGLTQPAVSAALERLRERRANRLFVRTSHGMRPTPYAHDMAGKVSWAPDILRERGQPTRFSPHITKVDRRIHINDLGMPNRAQQQTLRTTRHVCAVRSDHPDIVSSLSLEQFLRAKHGVYWTGESPYGIVEETLARLNRARDESLRVPRFAALPFLVAQSDLIVTIPEGLVSELTRPQAPPAC